LLLDRELNTLAEQPIPEKLKELQMMYKKVMELINISPNRDELVLECTIKLLDPLFNDLISINKINFLFAVLKELRILNENVPSFLLKWILLPNEKRILKVEIILKLIKDGYLLIKELDSALSNYLEASNNNVHIFLSITKIVKSLTIDEKSVPFTTFPKTIDYILRSIRVFKDMYPKMSKYLEDFRNAVTSGSENNSSSISYQPPSDNIYKETVRAAFALFDQKEAEYYDQAFSKLGEWLQITSEKEMPNFIKVLETTIFQAQEDKLTKFFAFIMDICVDHALSSNERGNINKKLAQNNAMDFSYIDAFSKLVIVILKTVINTDKKAILERILESSLLILTKNHELHKGKFNQRPFFRFFYNLIFVRNTYVFSYIKLQ